MTRANKIYVVYPYAQDRYNAVLVHDRAGNAAIHNAIAAFENDEARSGRRWKTKIEAGSFKIAKIADANNAAEAIAKAQEQGLVYEPKPTVLKRYRSEQSALKKDFEALYPNAARATLEDIEKFFGSDAKDKSGFMNAFRRK